MQSATDSGEQKPLFSRNLDSILNGKEGKMFVGGLCPNTSADMLKFYFEQFGLIEDSVIMRDAKTNLSRGFGFVTFWDPLCIQRVLEIKDHYLDGKKVCLF